MKFKDLFKLSTRMFKARASRTFLTILGMSVGIGAILFLVSLGYGLQNTLLEKVTTSDSLLTLDVTQNGPEGKALEDESIAEIKKNPEIAEVSPAFQLESRANMENLSTDLPVTAVDSFYLKLGGLKTIVGGLLNDQEVNGIVISSSVANIFNKKPEEIIGRNINFNFFVFREGNGDLTVGGKNYEKEKKEKYESDVDFKIIGVVESDDNMVYIHSGNFKNLKVRGYSQLKVKCGDSKKMLSVQSDITQKGFLVSSLSDTIDQANKVFRIVKIVLMLFGFIALIVSAIGMFNTMTITLLERTEEIGIMKSIGASDTMISEMFIMESTIMGFLGGLLGIIIGWAEGEIFNGVVNLIATHFGGEKVDLFYSPGWFIAVVVIFSAFVGLLTGIVPARRASGVDPLEALRYK